MVSATLKIFTAKKLSNKACTGRWGFCGFFKHFSLASPQGQAGFEFFLLPNRIHARPPATNYTVNQ
jgi:hypothetical protein